MARETLPPLEVRPYDVGLSLIVVAVNGMLPNQKGTFHASGADLESAYETRAVLVVRDTEGQWSTYHGPGISADDRTWHSPLEMARYIQDTVL